MTLRRGAYASATVILTLALAACGGASDETKVKQTMMREFVAVANGDGATACALTTPAGRQKLQSAVPGASCAQVVQLVSQRLPPTVKQGLRTARVNKATVNGNTATVQNSDITTSQGSLAGFTSGATMLTKQSDGTWLISG